jgi:hypothetical protein
MLQFKYQVIVLHCRKSGSAYNLNILLTVVARLFGVWMKPSKEAKKKITY